MKYITIISAILCIVFCINFSNAQDAWRTQYPEWWLRLYDEYVAAQRAWELGYAQAWQENMQKGIRRLNMTSHQAGITPLNGALLLTETDYTVPGRMGNLAITRFYDSKFWRGDTNNTNDYRSPSFWLGLGWDLHFGRYYAMDDDNGRLLEMPSGYKIYLSLSGNTHIATDGSFATLRADTLKIAGGMLIFRNTPIAQFQHDWYDGPHITTVYGIQKAVDKDGNVTSFRYRTDLYNMGDFAYYALDTIITSMGDTVRFYSREKDTLDKCYVLLDSITMKGYADAPMKISYHYQYKLINLSPFGRHFFSGNSDINPPDPDVTYYGDTYLLKSVVDVNGDSVYYDYNNYGELVGVHTTGGGLVKYGIASDSFYIPHVEAFPPTQNAKSLIQYNRCVDTVKIYDPRSASDTCITRYQRTFGQDAANRAVSNPDTIKIIHPDGNYEMLFFQASYAPVGRQEENQWDWDNGRLDSTKYYDKNQVFMKKERTAFVTNGALNILVPEKTILKNGTKTYTKEYSNYDDYGNAQLIYVKGDEAYTPDDYWIFRKFFNTDTNAKNKICFWWAGPPQDPWLGVQDSFYCDVGLDSIKVIRRWFLANLSDSTDSINTTYYNPPVNQGFVGSYHAKLTGYKYLRVISNAYYSGYNLQIVGTRINLTNYGSPPDVPPAESIVTNDYRNKGLYHLIKEEYIAPNSEGTDILSKTKYYYDSTDCIVKTYASLNWWQAPLAPQNVRGNPARIEQWKGSDEYVKSEFRYDNVGNLVLSITHPSTDTAETTFTHYDPPADPDKYQYAFPWRTVHHLSTSVCSLYTRTEYDSATGLVIKTFDANGDSTVFTHDSLNRLKKVWAPNSTDPTKTITYKDFASPEAVLDSTKIDANRWAVSKTFYDGFGRVIQTQQFDYDNSKTIIQNIAYNKNGLQDSVCNPYTISGTTGDYSTPSWSEVTSYQYEGLNRITKITHPDGDSIKVKYYANTDTVYDEKGNKTTYIYNAYGAIDTVIDALNNSTVYKYDTLGRLTSVTDAESKVTKYYYDKLSRLVAYDCPDAKSLRFYGSDSADVIYEYDDVGNLTRKKDANGLVDYSYDDIYRLTVVKHSSDSATWPDTIRLTYDFSYSTPGDSSSYYDNPKGRLGKMVTCGVDSMRYYYDDKGNLTRKAIVIKGLSREKIIVYRYNTAAMCTTLWATGVNNLVKYHYDQSGRLNDIPSWVSSVKYNPAGQITKMNYSNNVQDTIAYDNRFRPTYIKAYNPGPAGDDYLKLGYTYEDNSNVDSIHDYLISNNCQGFTYDALNRLTNVESSGGDQSFEYDKVGNRTKKKGTSYSYYTNTNRLQEDHRSYKYYYDDNGNILTHRTGTPGATIDSFAYNWLNRITFYKDIDTGETLSFAYNASGLRVKKYYYCPERGEGQDESGTLFSDASGDLGIKSTGADTVYNKGRDIEKIYIKNEANYFTFTVTNRYLFNESNKMKLFITLDLDTIQNSGRITLPEDTLTKVPAKAAWEYCVYISDNEYGLYKCANNQLTKHSMPLGMAINKVFGDSGKVQVKIAKSLLNNVPAIRYTIASFDPDRLPNPSPDTLLQNGSQASDVFPGTPATFGGEINGYGQISSEGLLTVTEYTIFYVYDGIDPIVEYPASGNPLASYVNAGGLHIGKIAGADSSWYHCDALGSPRKMTNELGTTVAWSGSYYPFGEATTSGTRTNTHQFTGKEMDSEMGLNYFCQRYYDPQIGRFMSLDPFGGYIELPQSQNRYAYVMNNPLKYIDPLGLVQAFPFLDNPPTRDIVSDYKYTPPTLEEDLSRPLLTHKPQPIPPGMCNQVVLTGIGLILSPSTTALLTGTSLLAWAAYSITEGIISTLEGIFNSGSSYSAPSFSYPSFNLNPPALPEFGPSGKRNFISDSPFIRHPFRHPSMKFPLDIPSWIPDPAADGDYVHPWYRTRYYPPADKTKTKEQKPKVDAHGNQIIA